MTPVGSKRLVVCMRTRDEPIAETRQALRDNMDGFEGPVLTVAGKRVNHARNELASSAIAQAAILDAEMVLWVDDDSWWPTDTVSKLADDLARLPESVVAGSFCNRVQYDGPVATRLDRKNWLIDVGLTRAVKAGLEKRELTAGELGPAFELRDAGELVQVLTIGAHLFAHPPDVLLHPLLMADPFTPWPEMKQAWIDRHDELGLPVSIISEDMIFSFQAQMASLSLYVDMGAPVAHIDRRSGVAYVPGKPAHRVKDNSLVAWEGPAPAPSGDRGASFACSDLRASKGRKGG